MFGLYDLPKPETDSFGHPVWSAIALGASLGASLVVALGAALCRLLCETGAVFTAGVVI